jgi:hypothetical protein
VQIHDLLTKIFLAAKFSRYWKNLPGICPKVVFLHHFSCAMA